PRERDRRHTRARPRVATTERRASEPRADTAPRGARRCGVGSDPSARAYAGFRGTRPRDAAGQPWTPASTAVVVVVKALASGASRNARDRAAVGPTTRTAGASRPSDRARAAMSRSGAETMR